MFAATFFLSLLSVAFWRQYRYPEELELNTAAFLVSLVGLGVSIFL